MQVRSVAQIIACLLLGIVGSMPATAQNAISFSLADAPSVPSRVVERVDDTLLVRLTGNTHPKAQPSNDKGAADPAKVLDRIILVLQRSPEQEKALADFNERQYDPKSPDFHRWLSAEEFGKLYGPSDSDIAAVSSWLENRGFQIDAVGKGRVWIQFTGSSLVMKKYLAVSGASPSWVFSTTPTNFVLLANAAQVPSTPLFQYYGYGSLGALSTTAYTTTTNLGANAATTAEVQINFQAIPSDGWTAQSRSASFSDAVVLRLSAASNQAGVANLPRT